MGRGDGKELRPDGGSALDHVSPASCTGTTTKYSSRRPTTQVWRGGSEKEQNRRIRGREVRRMPTSNNPGRGRSNPQMEGGFGAPWIQGGGGGRCAMCSFGSGAEKVRTCGGVAAAGWISRRRRRVTGGRSWPDPKAEGASQESSAGARAGGGGSRVADWEVGRGLLGAAHRVGWRRVG